AVVHANRGLAGIDGTIATATGLALRGSPVRVLIGDLTFQRDATSLIRGTLGEEVDLQVVVLDDRGGSVFAMLEHGQEKYRGVFARCVRTPQSLDMGAMARGAGAQSQRVRTGGDLRAAWAGASSAPRRAWTWPPWRGPRARRTSRCAPWGSCGHSWRSRGAGAVWCGSNWLTTAERAGWPHRSPRQWRRWWHRNCSTGA